MSVTRQLLVSATRSSDTPCSIVPVRFRRESWSLHNAARFRRRAEKFPHERWPVHRENRFAAHRCEVLMAGTEATITSNSGTRKGNPSPFQLAQHQPCQLHRIRSCRNDLWGSLNPFATLFNAQKPLSVASRVLPRHKSDPSGELVASPEDERAGRGYRNE